MLRIIRSSEGNLGALFLCKVKSMCKVFLSISTMCFLGLVSVDAGAQTEIVLRTTAASTKSNAGLRIKSAPTRNDSEQDENAYTHC